MASPEYEAFELCGPKNVLVMASCGPWESVGGDIKSAPPASLDSSRDALCKYSQFSKRPPLRLTPSIILSGSCG